MIIENPENFNNNEYESKYMDIESNFQIKCLFEKTTTIKKNAFKKDIIKRNLQKIFIN